jgi:hypothetical protein
MALYCFLFNHYRNDNFKEIKAGETTEIIFDKNNWGHVQ